MGNSKTIEERLARTRQLVEESDPRLWRHALANAVITLLASATPVTIDSLVAQLEGGTDNADPVIGRASIAAAIAKLRSIESGNHAGE